MLLAKGQANPRLCDSLEPAIRGAKLWALANNLWWSWHPECDQLFREIDPIRWRQLDHNPIALLREMTPEQVESTGGRIGAAKPNQLPLSAAEGIPGGLNTWGRPTPACLGPSRSRIFPPSSAFTNRFRFTAAVWAFWPATISRAPRAWACRLVANRPVLFARLLPSVPR
jgi:hypothetical protein